MRLVRHTETRHGGIRRTFGGHYSQRSGWFRPAWLWRMRRLSNINWRGLRAADSSACAVSPSRENQTTQIRPIATSHLSPEEMAQLPRDELLQACLEMRRLLSIIMGVLYTPDSTLAMRAVTIDLLYDSPVMYNIKSVSERLGIQPASVRQAYEQLDELGGVHIVARQFPHRREIRYPCPLMIQEPERAATKHIRCK